MNSFKELLDSQDASGLEAFLGNSYPFNINGDQISGLNDFGIALYYILNCSFPENFYLNKDPYILDEIKKFIIFSKTCPKGNVVYTRVRPEILRFEVEIGVQNYMQFDIHLGNGGYCISLDYIPISQTNLKN